MVLSVMLLLLLLLRSKSIMARLSKYPARAKHSHLICIYFVSVAEPDPPALSDYNLYGGLFFSAKIR
jgi:hypothetical protein